MVLALGSVGPHVRDLQQSLNQLPPTKLLPLAVDGKFGPKTRARVVEFQGYNNLAPDGIVGPLTVNAIQQLLDLLGLGKNKAPPTTSDVSVSSIVKSVLGVEPTNGLIHQFTPAIPIIEATSFRPGDLTNAPKFTFAPLKTARLGIFSARKANSERSVILLLPASGTPERVMIGISHQFGQNRQHYDSLGWNDPQSPALIQFVLLHHVLHRWGAQVLTAPQPTALFHIVRAAPVGNELGPFADDGPFVRDVLKEMAALTANAFSYSSVQAFTFSNGIFDFNKFLTSISGPLNVSRVINIDPRFALAAHRPHSGTVLRQYLSGQTGGTGGPTPGFEFLPYDRWRNETYYPLFLKRQSKFEYLHNHTLPMYTLSLGLRK